MPDFPTFLSMRGELYINFDILAEALDLDALNLEEYKNYYESYYWTYWRKIYTKAEAKTLSYWEDFFAKEETTIKEK